MKYANIKNNLKRKIAIAGLAGMIAFPCLGSLVGCSEDINFKELDFKTNYESQKQNYQIMEAEAENSNVNPFMTDAYWKNEEFRNKKLAISKTDLEYGVDDNSWAENLSEDEFYSLYKKEVIDEIKKKNEFTYENMKRLDWLLDCFFSTRTPDYFEKKDEKKEETNQNTDPSKMPNDEKRKILYFNIALNYPGLIQTENGTKIGVSYNADKFLNEREEEILKSLGYSAKNPEKGMTIQDFLLAYAQTADSPSQIQNISPIQISIPQNYISTRDFLVTTKKIFDYDINKIETHRTRKHIYSYSMIEVFKFYHPSIPEDCAERTKNDLAFISITPNYNPDKGKLYFKGIKDDVPIDIPAPFPLLTLIGGVAFPLIRQQIMRQYTKRKEDKFDILEYLAQLACAVFFDSAVPWLYPARLVVPFFFEPIRKLTKLKTPDDGLQ